MTDGEGILGRLAPARRRAVRERVADLLGEMTVEEKVGQLNQLPAGFLTGTDVGDADLDELVRAGRVGSLLNVESLAERRRLQRLAVEESRTGVPLLFAQDVIHGHRTISPVPLAEAATWDPDAVERAARMGAREAAADGLHWTFAPVADTTRDPRWGRVVETGGEATALSGAMAAARVRGFQGTGEDGDDDRFLADDDAVAACAKHYVGYGAVAAGREYNTVSLAEADLRDRHLPPFAAAVDAGAATVMSAFTVHERVPATASDHLLGVLREDLGFDGTVVSDWNAVGELPVHGLAADDREAARMALEAGTDVDMAAGAYESELAGLVADGDVAESTLDRAVRRVLELKGACGLFEDPYRAFDEDRRAARTLTDDHRDVAREVARESFVCLENDGVLPIDAGGEAPVDVALVGALADAPAELLGPWHDEGDPADVRTLREAFADRDGLAVEYARGYDLPGAVTDTVAAVEATEAADVAVCVLGEPADYSGEDGSRAAIDLPGDQIGLLEAVAATGTPTAAVLVSGRPLAVPAVGEAADAVVEAWFPGVEAGPAVADVLTGAVGPSGRLPIAVPRSVGQVPLFYDHLPTGRPKTDPDDVYVSRYVDEANDPLYPFGHGLTYGDVEYVGLAAGDELAAGGALDVRVTVRNAGDRPATETVQLYAHDRVGSRSRPTRELVAFERVRLPPGEQATAALTVQPADLAFWTADDEYAAEPGAFDLLAGPSAGDLPLATEFEYVG